MLLVVATTDKLSDSEYDSHGTDKNILSQLPAHVSIPSRAHKNTTNLTKL